MYKKNISNKHFNSFSELKSWLSSTKSKKQSHIFVGKYGEILRTYNPKKWLNKKNILHFEVNIKDRLCACSSNDEVKKIWVRHIPISDTFECFPEKFNFGYKWKEGNPIQKAWIESAKPKKEYEQRETISGGKEIDT